MPSLLSFLGHIPSSRVLVLINAYVHWLNHSVKKVSLLNHYQDYFSIKPGVCDRK